MAILATAFIFFNALKVWLCRSLIVWTYAGALGPFIVSTSLLFLLPAWYLLLTRRRSAWFLAFYILQALYMTANLWYFLYFRNYPSITQFFGVFGQGLELARNSAVPLYPQLLLGLVDLPLLAAVFVFRRGVRRALLGLKPRLLPAVCVVLLLSLAGAWGHFNPSRLRQIREDLLYFGDVVVVRYAGLPVLQVMELFKADRYGLHYSAKTFVDRPRDGR